jgi:putrescine aminotransferase
MTAAPSLTQTERWQQQGAEHMLHPFGDSGAIGREGARIITRAEGVTLWDSEGNAYLDAFAGLWCVNLGYGRQELVDVASQQMAQLPYYNLFFKSATPPAVELARVLSEIAPAHINHTFFTNSGSEANDTVVRMVRRYWDLKGQPAKKTIIGRHNGYHGSTVAGASLGGMSHMHAQGDLPIPGIAHIRQPYWFGEGGDMTPDAFGRVAAQALEDKILELGPEHVAAFIAEPIQGAGGIIIPPATYWPDIERIVKQYDLLLVVDEVICGFGRTGQWFGSDYYGLTPDLMSIAKGLSSGYLPIGGVMVADRVAEVIKASGGEFNHGFTYSGHPVCAAVALENIRILREEGIVNRVRQETAPYLQAQLQTLADHPLVGEVRGVGMLGAVELVQDTVSRRRYPEEGRVGTLCRDYALQQGLVLRATGDTMLMSPPLIIKPEEIDELVRKTRAALDQTQAQLEKEYAASA